MVTARRITYGARLPVRGCHLKRGSHSTPQLPKARTNRSPMLSILCDRPGDGIMGSSAVHATGGSVHRVSSGPTTRALRHCVQTPRGRWDQTVAAGVTFCSRAWCLTCEYLSPRAASNMGWGLAYPGTAHGSQRDKQKSPGNGDEQGRGSQVPSTRYIAGLPGVFHGSFEMQPCRRESLSHAPPFAFRPHGIVRERRSQFGVGASLP